IEDLDWDFFAAEQVFGPEPRRSASPSPSARADGAEPSASPPWPSFAIPSGDALGALWLRGSVDRVDRAPGGASARVVDYKRSKSTVPSAMGALGEPALQVPLYAVVVRPELRLPTTGKSSPT